MQRKDIEQEFLNEVVPDKQRSTRKKTINQKKKAIVESWIV